MNQLESSLHLYQPPLYRAASGEWVETFLDAVAKRHGKVTWDPAAILAIISFNYVCGDRTLVNEVKRQPWLSLIGPDNAPVLEDIPQHGRLWKTHGEIANDFRRLLHDEALEVCRGRKEIYLLLSGGLDSRVIAGILADLFREDRLEAKPVCVTWGLEDSRDVAYGRMVAEILGFEWIHLNLRLEDLRHNADEMAIATDAIVSPLHLHRVDWFENVSREALVLAASYGDSAARLEYSGRNLLELDYLRPANTFGLIRSEVTRSAYDGVMSDLNELRDRSAGQPKYVICEHEMLGHYMRNMIAHVMSAINRYCKIYQMFTDPRVYKYMWSIHPALRTHRIYAELLETLHPKLARMPWARTNRALSGRTVGAKRGLRRHFLDYSAWGRGPLYDELNRYIDPEWFSATGIFDGNRIRSLAEQVRLGADGRGQYGYMPHEKWLWLASFRRIAERLEALGKSVELSEATPDASTGISRSVPMVKPSCAPRAFRRAACAYRLIRRLRKAVGRIRGFVLRRRAVRQYPPERTETGRE
jgi:asparagine synthase (glutamine-hydrolysing)